MKTIDNNVANHGFMRIAKFTKSKYNVPRKFLSNLSKCVISHRDYTNRYTYPPRCVLKKTKNCIDSNGYHCWNHFANSDFSECKSCVCFMESNKAPDNTFIFNDSVPIHVADDNRHIYFRDGRNNYAKFDLYEVRIHAIALTKTINNHAQVAAHLSDKQRRELSE
eukprot:349638_1